MRPCLQSKLLLGCALLLLLACGDSEGGGSDQTSYEYCVVDGRGREYEPGMSDVGQLGLYELQILDVSPAPPDVGASEWLVEISDLASGEPGEGCTLTGNTWMPDHGHGGPEGSSQEEPEPGRYRIEGLRYLMAGYWETAIEIECPELGLDEVQVPFCIEG